jgi:cobalt-zinc-cadmium efflux system membrane fusion protein
MFANIRHSHGTLKSRVVPRTALFQQENRTLVYRQRGAGEFEEVAVEVIWQDEQIAAIRDGLKPGDPIVVDGITLLRAY